MQGRGKRDSSDRRPAALTIRKVQRVVVPNLIFRTGTAIKIGQVRAAAKGDVLAIVDYVAIGQRIRRGTSPQVRTLFEQADSEARFSQRDGGGQPRQSAADYQNALRGHPFSTGLSSLP